MTAAFWKEWYADQKERGVMMTEKKQPWWKNAVVYQIYPKSFQDSNGMA